MSTGTAAFLGKMLAMSLLKEISGFGDTVSGARVCNSSEFEYGSAKWPC